MRFLPVVGITTHDLADTHGAPRSGGRTHKGIDIFAPEGRGVVAATSGTVVKAGDSGGLGGLRVWIKDDDGLFHYYAHLSAVDVKDGQRVEAGARIGAVGKTGNAQNTPPHLHYSVNPQGTSSEQGSFNAYDYLLGANSAPHDSTEAAARRVLQGEGPQPTAGGMTPDPAQAQQDQQRLQKDTVTSIMQSISQAARRSNDGNGQTVDVRALFGNVFDEPDDDMVEVA